MKAKVLISSILLSVAFFSCDKHANPVPFEGVVVESEGDDTTPPILLYTSQQTLISDELTKGTGSVYENDDNYSQHKRNMIYDVYAFKYSQRAGYKTDYSARSKDNEYLCLLDNPNEFYRGQPALATGVDINAFSMINNIEDRSLVVHRFPKDENTAYDFFVYTLDDLKQDETTVHRSSEQISADIHIDGSQDIQCGYSVRLNSAKYLTDNYRSLTTSEITKISQQGAYSTYAARKGIYPLIKMKHILTRLCFWAYPADAESANISIEKIGVTGNTTGNIILVDYVQNNVGRCTWTSEQEMVYMHDIYKGKPTELMSPVKIDPSFYNPEVHLWEREATRLGESIMLPAKPTYDVTIWYSVDVEDEDGNIETFKKTSSFTLSIPNASFQSGSSYNVKVALYGKEELKFVVEKNERTDYYSPIEIVI